MAQTARGTLKHWCSECSECGEGFMAKPLWEWGCVTRSGSVDHEYAHHMVGVCLT